MANLKEDFNQSFDPSNGLVTIELNGFFYFIAVYL